jgi:hypothetical protein
VATAVAPPTLLASCVCTYTCTGVVWLPSREVLLSPLSCWRNE